MTGWRIAAVLLSASSAFAHDLITTPITWSREISRIVYAKCAACHHEGGRAFSLMTYKEARPWAVAIKEETLRRRMPPWGAVKGFGEFRNDQALTPEELELIVSWVEGGVPEGEPKELPEKLPSFEQPAYKTSRELLVNGDLALTRALTLDGLWPRTVPKGASFQIVAELPDGRVEPLVWIKDYNPDFGHPFLLRKPMSLPKGTVIRGVVPGGSIALLSK